MLRSHLANSLRLSLMGAWLMGTAFVWVVATENFRRVDGVKKEVSTKTHEERRRSTKRDGSASTTRSATKRILNIDAQDAQDFSGNGWLAILSIRNPAPDHRPSRLLVQKPLVL